MFIETPDITKSKTLNPTHQQNELIWLLKHNVMIVFNAFSGQILNQSARKSREGSVSVLKNKTIGLKKEILTIPKIFLYSLADCFIPQTTVFCYTYPTNTSLPLDLWLRSLKKLRDIVTDGEQTWEALGEILFTDRLQTNTKGLMCTNGSRSSICTPIIFCEL